MTNIAQHAFTKRNKVIVLSDGSKLSSSDFDNKCKFDIFRFDQIKFLRNKIKSKFAKKLFDSKKFDVIFFDTWKSLEHIENKSIKKICLIHGNEILNINKKKEFLNH